ncbi:GRIP and coiled-coil domain-containing protein [Halyomorpha halys]|uniref:GRIP and coiled-coil domain-containing protein n=1 Tax=Halyomorpha halys TaxID=286706 RepID=UPI0006D4C9D5|nr:uncharacterized protein LOC106687972 [Halyomorpha halys]
MFTEVHVNSSMKEECSQTMSGLVKKLIGKKEVSATTEEALKKQTYNLMKELARKIVYKKTDQANGETKTEELTEKTEFSMRESVYTLIRKKPKKKKKECVKSQVLKQNTRSLHYSNVCQMIKNNTTKLIRNKLTLQENSKKIVKKRTFNREKSLAGSIESMEKLLSSWKKDFKKKPIVENLKWSMKSTYKSLVLENEIMEQHITPVAIVPPLSLPLWAKALDEPPQTVILRRTPSLNSFLDRTLRAKLIMRRRMRNGSRRAKACMIPAETLARVLATQKWNKGPRQVPVSTFQATKIHYRFLLAKYGKSGLMGRHRVYPNSIKSNVHSNYSVINLLHDVEEAISQNKYSKETDKIVKNFKDELNKDLLYNEPINRKYKYPMGNPNHLGTIKKSKFSKQSSGMSLSELVEKLGGNDSDDSCNDIESDIELKSETYIENGQLQCPNTNNGLKNSLVDSASNGELFKSFNNDFSTADAFNELKNNIEDMETSKVSQTKKEKRNIKKKKTLVKEPKPENISEEERLSNILHELRKQVKASEVPTPLVLTKNDSLTELNFEKEPCTYLSMQRSSSTINSANSQPNLLESTIQKECSNLSLPTQQESKQSPPSPSEPTSLIKTIKPPKSQHSSTKLYSFRIDYESIKNKPMSICNIITALDRVNKLLQNIPIQYDKNTGRPYIVYDPKTIVKVIKEVNIKHEYKMVVKKHNKKTKTDSETEKSLCETNTSKPSKIETMVKKDEKCLAEVGNQLLKCILSSMKPPNINECVSCTEDKEEVNNSSQTFDLENSKYDESLGEMTENRPVGQSIQTGSLKLPDENVETIKYKKKYFEQITITAVAYHIPGIYHHTIIYMERSEYFNDVQPIDCHQVQDNKHEMNQTRNKENNITKLHSNSYMELKEKYMGEFKEHKNELSKKYGRHLTNETLKNISQKYYQQYSKTRKLLLSKYELKRSINKESVNKGVDHLKTALHESFNNNESHAKTNEPENKDLTTHIPTTQYIQKSHIIDENKKKSVKDTEMFQYVKCEDVKNKNYPTKGQARPIFNSLIAFDQTEEVITNKNNSLTNTKNNSEGFATFSLNKSIMNNMLRSVSINTIPNTYPIRKDTTKQVFYFQTISPLITDLNDIYKKRPSQEFFKPSQDDILSKFIYYKENNKLQTCKKDINQQVMDSVNTIKNDLTKNINNICQIVNIDNHFLIKFLKICVKQNELDFKEDGKSWMLEKEMEELKSQMEIHLGKKTNPLRLIQRKHEGSSAWQNQRTMVFENNSKKKSTLRNELNMEEINVHQLLNNNRLCIEILRLTNLLMLIFSLISFFC